MIMKPWKTAAALLAAALAPALGLTSCGDTETEWVTAPTVSAAQAVVTAPDEGGTVTVGLTITNPAEGATVSASPSASWVEVTSCTETALALSVSENPNSDPRTARVTVSYSYSVAGSKGTATCEVTVAQSCGDQPALSVQPTAVAAAVEGGSYSFNYTVVNPASDGEVSASCSASWISDIDCSVEGSVGFGVEENTETALRQAEITLSYSWANGSLSESVTVVQDHQGGSGDDGGSDGGIEGTYTAAGRAYAGSGIDDDATWTLKIYEYNGSVTAHFPTYSGGFDCYIDGLAPSAEGMYDYYGDHRLSAAAYVDGSGNLVVPTQVLNTTSSGYYVGWTPCTAYSASGWSYNYGWPDITFVYNSGSDCWESEYGVFMGAFNTTSLTVGVNSGFYSFFDVVSPGMTLTKTSDTTSLSAGDTGRHTATLESLETHFDFNASSAPVPSSGRGIRAKRAGARAAR